MTALISADDYALVRAAWTAMDQTYGGVAEGQSLMPTDNSASPTRPARRQPFEIPSGYTVKKVIPGSPTGKFTIYSNPTDGVIMVVPTGTNGNGDIAGWASNFLDQGKSQWEFSKLAVFDALNKELRLLPGNNRRVVFAGDSRGGALAQFALNDFVATRPLQNSPYEQFTSITNDELAIITHVSPGVRGLLGEEAVPVTQLAGIASHHSATKLKYPSGSGVFEEELVSKMGGAYLDPSWPIHYYSVPTPYPDLPDAVRYGIAYAHRLAHSGWDYFYQNPGAGFGSFSANGQPRSFFTESTSFNLARLFSIQGDPQVMSAFESYFRLSQLATCTLALSPAELAQKILLGESVDESQWAALSIIALSNSLAIIPSQLATAYCVASSVLTFSGLVDWVPGDAGIQETQDFRAQAKAGATPLPGFVNKEAKYTADGGVLVVDASETGDFITYGFSFNNHFSFGTLNGKPVGSFNKNSWTVDDAGVTTLISESGQPVAIRAFGLPDILPAQGLVQFLLADSEGAVLATVSPDSTRGGVPP